MRECRQNAKQPNSFIYRYVPKEPSDLTQGKRQALQVLSLVNGQPSRSQFSP